MTATGRSNDVRHEEAAGGGGVRRWRAFWLLAVAFLMTIVDLAIVNVALPTIGRKLHFPQQDLQWVVTAYALTFGGFLLLGGRAADLLGRRRLFLAGLALFTAASLACALATGDTFLIVMRGIQGLGAAVVLPAALSIVMNMFREGAERNKALGIWGGIGAAGATIGVLAGGLLTRYAGWQYIFFLNVPIGAAALLLGRRVVPESRLRSARRRYDVLGAITVTGALVVLVYAISQAPAVGWTAARTLALLAASAALLAGFLVIETRAKAPLLPLRLFQLRTLAGSNVAGFLLGASFFAFIFVATLYMQQVLGYSALKTGISWLAASLTSVALAGVSQMLVTRASAKLVMAAGMVLIGAGILWATQVPVHGQFWADLAGPFFVTGAGVYRSARRCGGARCGDRLGTAQHLPADRRCDRGRGRLDRGGDPLPPAAEPGAHGSRRAHRRIPVGVLGHRAHRTRSRPRHVPAHPAHRTRPRRGRLPATADPGTRTA
jgi:EmrB/QacA subfamily drug resistance transporter